MRARRSLVGLLGLALLGSALPLACGAEGDPTDREPLATVKQADSDAPGAWENAAPMHTPRERHAAVVLLDGRVLVAGGTDGAKTLASAELYDPQADAWTDAPPMAKARVGHTLTRLADGRVLVTGGGIDGGYPESLAELFDPKSDTWTLTDATYDARRAHTATLLSDGRVLVVGGDDGFFPWGTAELYDPAAGQFQFTAPPLDARVRHSAMLLPDGDVLVAGGYDGGFTTTAHAERYRPSTNTWTAAQPMASARRSFPMALAGGQIMVHGGLGDGTVLGAVERYDHAADLWTAAGFSGIRALFPMVTLRDGRVLAIGGDNGFSADGSVIRWAAESNGWTVVASLAQGRMNHAAVLLDGGEVFVSGGAEGEYPGDAVYATAERYRNLGAPCGAEEDCAGGFCVDGICCDTPCDGVCQSCSQEAALGRCTPQPKGTDALGECQSLGCDGTCNGGGACTFVPVGGPCAPSRCIDDGHAQSGVACLGVGVPCPVDASTEIIACGAYVCDPTTGTCPAACASLQDCAPGFACNLEGQCVAPPAAGPESGCALVSSAEDGREGLGFVVAALGWALLGRRRGRRVTGWVLGLALLLGETREAHAGRWTPGPPMHHARRDPGAVSLQDGSVLVFGAGATGLSTERFEPVAGLWTEQGSLSTRRDACTAVRLADGRVLAIGGWSATGGVDGVERFDPTTGTWTAVASMGTARAGHGAVTLSDGRVLVVGGAQAINAHLASAELYDPTTDTWRPTATEAHAARYEPTVVPLSDGRVLVTGGDGAVSELYDPVADTWTLTAPATVSRLGAPGILLENGQVLVVGGVAEARAELFDPETATWRETGSMAVARTHPALVRLGNGTVLVVGSDDPNAKGYGAEVYDPATERWTVTAPVGLARGGASATLLPDGRVLVAGGFDSSFFANPDVETTELYDTLGDLCTSSLSCSGGVCVGGVCCDGHCECGTCDPTGHCGATPDPLKAGAACAPPACLDATHAALAALCLPDSLPCPEAERIDCVAYTCEPTTGTCRASCQSSADCASGFACNLEQHCARPPRASDGGAGCTTASEGRDDGAGTWGALLAATACGVWGRRRRKHACTCPARAVDS